MTRDRLGGGQPGKTFGVLIVSVARSCWADRSSSPVRVDWSIMPATTLPTDEQNWAAFRTPGRSTVRPHPKWPQALLRRGTARQPMPVQRSGQHAPPLAPVTLRLSLAISFLTKMQ